MNSHILLQKDLESISKNDLIEELKQQDYLFQQEFEPYKNLSLQDIQIINHWYYSQQGQQELYRFIHNLWNTLYQNAAHAMPAHDARHALFKVPIFSLQYIQSENVQGWLKMGVIGALTHDWGRWSEERIFGNAQGGMTHARMSFILLRDFLKDYDIPQIVQYFLLDSVIQHTSGAVSSDHMPLKLTVSPDRDQLVGPEMVLRLIHHKPEKNDLEFIIDSQENSRSVISSILKMYFTRLPGPLFSLENHLMDYFFVSFMFAFMNLSEKEILNIYETKYKKHENVYFQKSWLQKDLAFTKKIIPTLQFPEESLENRMLELLNSSNTCPKDEYKFMAIQKTKNLNELQKEKLNHSLYFINIKKKEKDQQQIDFLTKFSHQEQEPWINWLSTQLLNRF